MTILFVTHYAGFYGANKSLYTLMLLLREKYGVKPVVLLPSAGPMCVQLDSAGIPYKVSHYYWWVNDNHGLFQWLLNKRKQIINYFRIPKLCQLFSEHEPQLIYTNSVCVNVGLLMAVRLGLPHVWQARESLSQFSLSLSLVLSRHVWALPATKAHILISDYMMDYYRPYLPADRMVRIYNGVDLPADKERQTENKINGRLKVAIVGVVCGQKNQLELLKAQYRLLQQGIQIETYIIGTSKPAYQAQLQQYVSDKGMAEWVHFVGHTDDVFGMLEEMNVGVVSATDEAFGRTTIEFMLKKMPVVVSDSGANAELLRHGQEGYVYPSGDVEALAEAIQRYAEQPELLQTQGESAYQYAKANFSAAKNAENIYEIITKAINK